MAEELELNAPVKVCNPYIDYFSMRGVVTDIVANAVVVRIDATDTHIKVNRDDLKVLSTRNIDYEAAWEELREALRTRIEYTRNLKNSHPLFTGETPSQEFYVDNARYNTLKMIMEVMDTIESEYQ